jgi:hypothetical protein
MNRNDPDAKKLIDFCIRLPALPGDAEQARTETRWALKQFEQRRSEVQQALSNGSTEAHEWPSLRCEISALEAACSVLMQLWQRRFGSALTVG